jgi:3-hydroxyisobutyrate dehydrogenase-like beta-hydroxyacid dehydrogenase
MPSSNGLRVGFAGLGIMGWRMAANVATAGFDLTVWNRTHAKAERFAAEHRAAVAESPAALGRSSDVVITMVVDGAQVEEVLLGDAGVASAAGAGKRSGELLCVDMSTIGRAAARRIGAALEQRGIRLVDAPVTGSSPKAEDGTLTIMAGGEEGDFTRVRPLLEAMGSLIVHVGPLGQGQMAKLINNTVAAVNTAVVGEALLLARRAGLDMDALLAVMGAGSGGSAMLDLKARPMLEHDYETLFKLEHMLKDIRLCLYEAEAVGDGMAEAEALGRGRMEAQGVGQGMNEAEALGQGVKKVGMTFAEEAERVLAEADAAGFGQQDFAALIEALERRSGTRL